MLSGRAGLECCYSYTGGKLDMGWIKWIKGINKTQVPLAMKSSDDVDIKTKHETGNNKHCGTLTFKSVKMDETGLYQCWLNSSVGIYSHGTYLHVYSSTKTINLRESTKNKILTAEGILLFLCVLLPSVSLLFQSKRLNQLEKKKARREEENIYQVNFRLVTTSLSQTRVMADSMNKDIYQHVILRH
ncbi:B-cell antigen receptor complex-associated protein alpha chain [Nibea albiflora]|uniref:B-cell antigen receptor complex-associated protein alpha chain n=1 Tax=Nibea albiflora TaxID=240163 RepID=A0ACB7F7D4_NIBAL|nr:B-cell antigen receptor complex-associated protein alpha chain [Nibea albiflora]